jgi:hypothetical protein
MRVLTAIRSVLRGSDRLRSLAALVAALAVVTAWVASRTPLYATELPHDNDAARELYFNGLRERGLYSLAETVCLTQLEQSDMTLPERTAIVIELSRTFAAHASSSAAFEDQTELLQRARFVIDDLLASSVLHPQRVLLEVQSAFVAASEVEVLRWQDELSPLPGKAREQALQLSESLLVTFADLIERMADELRNRPRVVSSDRLSPYRIRGLKRTSEYRLGMLLLDRARLFEAGSADQAEALLAAKDRFRDLAGGEPDERITLQSQLSLIEATRLSGDAAIALRMCETLLEDQPPAGIRNEVIAEKIESLLALDRSTDAADELREFRRNPQMATGRLLFLNVLVLLGLSEVAAENGDASLATELRYEAAGFAARAGVETPGYWSLRARRLITAGDAVAEFGPEAAPHVERGRSFFKAGQIADAIVSYRTGWQLLRESERVEQASEVGYTLGSLLLNEDQFEEAQAVLNDVAAVAAGTPRAVQADFLRLFALARLYQRQPSRVRREAYVAALEQHREEFPEADSFGDATWMLAQLQEARLQTTLALRLYTEIPESHARHGQAIVGVARCGETILDRLRKLGKPRADWEAAIMGEIAEQVRPLANGDAPLTASEGELLLRTARLLLSFQQPDFSSADRLLDRLIVAQAAVPESADVPLAESAAARQTFVSFQRSAQALKVVSLAGTGQSLDAKLLLNRLGTDQPDSLADVLKLLAEASGAKIDRATGSVLGELQVRAMELSTVDLDSLPIERQIPLRLALADAHEQSGMAGSAARELAIVSDALPADRALRWRLARLQLASRELDLIVKAKGVWRGIENQSKAGSNDWLEARRRVIECCLALDQTDEAGKLLKITMLLYPQGGSPETRDALDRLAKEHKPR